ncbi:hypothetical protein Val02_66710 [Virgisporangium aliadipatigenens]|uniref:HD domain-containing protein n=1 Tax=Virgisporangium aliadipatigenens TaxID=741659 RepID=A0A8J3YTT8_9ACTN|nr:hypothetical protein [Virgisporangium aliadipatigenens]GIJ49785.1 hypothetical protein Val02_66710 [Virgisporangium aliadipatigenens]
MPAPTPRHGKRSRPTPPQRGEKSRFAGILPNEPLVRDALALAQSWSIDIHLDGSPALGHVIQLASVLRKHVDRLPPYLIVVALLHDAARLVGDFDEFTNELEGHFGEDTMRILRELRDEHTDGRPVGPELLYAHLGTLFVSAADQILTLGTVLQKGARIRDKGGDPTTAWRDRPDLAQRMCNYERFAAVVSPYLEPRLGDLLTYTTGRAKAEAALFLPG